MYVSYSSIPANGSASSTQINSKKDPNNQFGVVLTSINHSNTNSLSSTYIKTHNYPPSSINSPAKTHQQMQSPTSYRLDQRQLSSSSNLSQYNSRNNLINKSASTQQIVKRNPSFTSGSNRSDIRYTEIISATDDILSRMDDERDADTSSNRSFCMSQASTAAASPIIQSKLMATNLAQQQLITKNFGIHNPLNSLIENEVLPRVSEKQPLSFEFGSHGQLQQQYKNQQKQYSANHNNSSPRNQPRQVFASPTHSSPQHQFAARSPNLSHLPRRRQSQQQAPPVPYHQPPQFSSIPHQLELSHSNSKLSMNGQFGDHIREPPPLPLRYNLNQFIPEYHCPPLPAIPPHMMQHPMYRVRSQDRISNRLRRQSGAHHPGATPHDSQRPRSFCNNMINYQDYKDIQ